MSAQPRCRWCGRLIPKYSYTVFVKEEPGPHDAHGRYVYTGKGKRLRSKAECIPLTSQTVLAVSYSEERNDYHGPVTDRYISHFTVWDGATYQDRFFCNGNHARAMGYAAAERGWSSKSWGAMTDETVT